MFEYVIVWRIDDEEFYSTECMTVKAHSVREIINIISDIEKNHTITSITNISV